MGHIRDSEVRPCELTVEGDTFFSVRLGCQLWLDRLDSWTLYAFPSTVVRPDTMSQDMWPSWAGGWIRLF